MTILRDGAKELGLKPCYQKWLAEHPVQVTSPMLRVIAVNNIVFSMTMWRVLGTRSLTQAQSWLLVKFYVLPSDPWVKRLAGEIASGIILLPGSLLGFFMRPIMNLTNTMSPQVKGFIENVSKQRDCFFKWDKKAICNAIR